MTTVNWDEFKVFKKHSHKQGDNFEILLDFLKSYYNMTNPAEMYEIMINDDIAPMMLEKRDINSNTDLEKHLFKHFDAL